MPFAGAADDWLDITFCLTGAFHHSRRTEPLDLSVHAALSARTFSFASMSAGTPASSLLHHLAYLVFSFAFLSLRQGFQQSNLIIRLALRDTPEPLALKSEVDVAALPRSLLDLRCACALHQRARSTGPREHWGARGVQKRAWARAGLNWCCELAMPGPYKLPRLKYAPMAATLTNISMHLNSILLTFMKGLVTYSYKPN